MGSGSSPRETSSSDRIRLGMKEEGMRGVAAVSIVLSSAPMVAPEAADSDSEA